jgi:hypothetical protein
VHPKHLVEVVALLQQQSTERDGRKGLLLSCFLHGSTYRKSAWFFGFIITLVLLERLSKVLAGL